MPGDFRHPYTALRHHSAPRAQARGLQRRFGSSTATPDSAPACVSALRAVAQRTSPGLLRPFSGVSRWARSSWACQPSTFPSRAFTAPQGLTSHQPSWPCFMPQPLVGFVVFRAFPTLAAVTVSGPLPSCHYEITTAADLATARGSCDVQHFAVPSRWTGLRPSDALRVRRSAALTGQ